MDFREYQRLSRRTAQYPRAAWLAYPALGLAGEAGEVAEHAKKAIRDDSGTITDERRAAMAKELGELSQAIGAGAGAIRAIHGRMEAAERALPGYAEFTGAGDDAASTSAVDPFADPFA